ncbi:HK97 family phage prohead protease [Acholeplasma laidlawii]|uniref:Peptidase U35 n=2 Tax=Acholeplasma laidlawii TaxID=2148 RepID=A9NFU8_ACHLI|nr:HK97 family phage prohead protease [Acholeplasma laidlawii]ABX81228.1 peptidase U35 [Acholeplasma laidlawii PG-8A]NWH10199.1 HK97 family phage prohead protease [Acholeplasma laidlawii]NWH11590.1 HK97 family phage prohead protease [Acholeplasma laidlawii]NWH13001.1 HK97 family phage prohead protease [Acholeplasma laidlawii]NWH14732.1 HK97 family phage prohead protease [Acholeplasma laidlawii]
MKKETRIAEVKLEETDDKMILEGYAIVYDEPTLIGDESYGFIESISRSAITDAAIKDVPMKYNHMDSFLIIARTKNGSLTLTSDDVGLKVRAELLDTQSNQDIFKMVKSGLLDKMSFAFVVSEQEWDRSGNIPKRNIRKIERLYDVSIVDTPAYDKTSIYARSLEAMDLELKTMDLAEKNKKTELIRKKLNLKIKIGE